MWEQWLTAVADDVYHGSGYHRYVEESEGARAFLAVVQDPGAQRGFVWPYLLRPIALVDSSRRVDLFDVDSVYGYPGPLAWGCQPRDEFVRMALEEIVSSWRGQGAIAAFTRFNPLLDNVVWAEGLPAPGPDGLPSILPLGETVAIELRQSDDSAVASYSRTLRQEIGRARRAGMTTRLDDWSGLETFARLYRATMTRSGAAATYYYSTEEFRRLRNALGTELHLHVTELGGQTVAAGLFTEHRGIVQAHLVGTDDAFRQWSPLKLLLDDVRRWATERGNEVLHLGGGLGGRDDSLFAFKARFSPRRHQYSVGRWVLDPNAYSRLVSARAGQLAEKGLRVTEPAWFPEYRAPVTDARTNPKSESL